jgi:phosphoribosylaminoimidazolecarboxamide formyltransferase/IMP cyclohydrolase
VVTDPERYDDVLAVLERDGSVPDTLRARLALDAFRHTAAYDARIAAELERRLLPREAPPMPEAGAAAGDPFPERLIIALDKVATLRYGENPHQPGAVYRRAGARSVDGPFARGVQPLQGKDLSYNNLLDASAAAGAARLLRGPAAIVVKHMNPCGAAERDDLLSAWRAALAGDPVSAFGGVVALTRPVDGALAEALTAIFLEVLIAPAFEGDARAVLAARPNLRLLTDPELGSSPLPTAADPLGSLRTAGGAVLVTARDDRPPDPSTWRVASTREPTPREHSDLDLAWRLVRSVTSNAIVLVRDGMLIGLGSGQTSRVDAAEQAVAKARRIHGDERLHGAVCASDAFFPFPDGVETCTAAGVSAFVQPGGSVRDAEVVAAAQRSGAAMVLTGMRHFRH